ncbi:FAD-dependent oxidoreductase [Mycobacterium sp. 1274756.6]|uniref:FAD-dependent oxidoreductase n=1 Tax=Mycobacterium sp. 1274756.6 TaxID=1834076 RepID=UPI0007FC53B8|nr:FAD-dependent oxidoreductase [Mycobacterium sp. 1274756.6]OBJ68323.1 potassium transporter [Mycobacterium sp. 1274756.6]
MSTDGSKTAAPRDVDAVSCDLCIVGAGIAGLNALFSASRYLSADQTIVLVDRRARVGGMWVDTYSYVRLHQPHPMFTAGNIKWTSGKDPSYLATKGEVLDHLRHCVEVIKQRVHVDEYFGWEFESEEETGGQVWVRCRSVTGRFVVIAAKRLIKAYGLGATPNEPLTISSSRLRSVSPDYCDIRGGEMRESDTPVWIIGGGKTAMDTAYTLITECPGREVNLVAGRGTFFGTRDRLFPSGARRWWGGESVAGIVAELGRRFDGTNEAEVQRWFRPTYGNFVTPDADNYLFGVLSQAENKTIAAGLNGVVMDYFTDAVDRNGSTTLMFRSGATTTIPPGSWVINCTGYVGLDGYPYEPYVAASGAVISINLRSAVLHLPAFMGYFLTHLLFSGKISEVPLYELDWQDLRRKSPIAFPYTVFALAQHNLSLIYDAVPSRVFRENGLDFDTWYPLARRLPGMVRFMLTHRRERERQRRVLDTVRDRFDVRCGTLESGGSPHLVRNAL